VRPTASSTWPRSIASLRLGSFRNRPRLAVSNGIKQTPRTFIDCPSRASCRDAASEEGRPVRHRIPRGWIRSSRLQLTLITLLLLCYIQIARDSRSISTSNRRLQKAPCKPASLDRDTGTDASQSVAHVPGLFGLCRGPLSRPKAQIILAVLPAAPDIRRQARPPTLRRASLLTFILVALSYWLPCRAYTTNGSVTPLSETTWSLWDWVPDVCSQGRGVRAARLPRSARLRSCSRRSPGRGDVPGLSHYDSKKATTMCCHKCNSLTALALRLWGSDPCQDAIPFDPMKLQPVGFNRAHGPAAT
jgi:hypothetical protein